MGVIGVGIVRQRGGGGEAVAQSKLLKTGQIVQYDGMEDDGYFQKGVARDYTAFTTGQYSGTTNITVNAKTIAMENACVVDNQTGLMWMKYTPDSNIGPENNGRLYWYDATNREDIFEFCDQANAQNLAGHNDWRVPNLFELYSLIVEDTGIGAPFIDTTYFQCVNYSYWSSTTYPNNVLYSLAVLFGYGGILGYAKVTSKFYLRLVRG